MSRTLDLRPGRVGGRAGGSASGTRPWGLGFRVAHANATSALLLALTLAWLLVGPSVGPGFGASALLVGGAVIGVPHGTADFVVAHRLLHPTLGRIWLPTFVLAYGALVGAVLLAWAAAPLVTLTAFLLVSGLHFGREDREAYDLPASAVRVAARASTPLVPIVMLHLPDVVPFFATMGGRDAGAIAALLDPLRLPVLAAWATIVAVDLGRVDARPRGAAATEACELAALSLASAVLPPLVTFAFYFCGIHAVRHMVHLTAEVHPRNGRRALRLAAAIVLPSATLCIAVLCLAWSAVAGPMPTDSLLCTALRLVAALTVPHMLLDALCKRVANGGPALVLP